MNTMSDSNNTSYVLRGIKEEMRENILPHGMKYAAKFAEVSPYWLLTNVLLSRTPERY